MVASEGKADERLLSLLGAAVDHRLFLFAKTSCERFCKKPVEAERHGPGHKAERFRFLRREYRGREPFVRRCKGRHSPAGVQGEKS